MSPKMTTCDRCGYVMKQSDAIIKPHGHYCCELCKQSHEAQLKREQQKAMQEDYLRNRNAV